MKLKNLQAGYELLEKKYGELKKKSEIPRTVYLTKKVEKEKIVGVRIGNKADKLIDMFWDGKKYIVKELLFAVLFYHKQFKFFNKKYIESKFFRKIIFLFFSKFYKLC